MSNVIVKENETLDSALRRFKRSCAKAGIQQEIRKREHYEKPSVNVRRSLKQLENVNIINKYNGTPEGGFIAMNESLAILPGIFSF